MSDTLQAGSRSPVSRLDGALVLAVVAIVGAGLGCLFFVKAPQENLPIIAGTLGTLIGTVIGGYAGFRWGASAGDKRTVAPAPAAPAADPAAAPPPGAA